MDFGCVSELRPTGMGGFTGRGIPGAVPGPRRVVGRSACGDLPVRGCGCGGGRGAENLFAGVLVMLAVAGPARGVLLPVPLPAEQRGSLPLRGS
jgi:hypothetical protein